MQNTSEISFPTYRAMDDYSHQQWQILLDSFEFIKKETWCSKIIEVFGEEGLYLHLYEHQQLLKTSVQFSNEMVLKDGLSSRYRRYKARGIDCECLSYEIDVWLRFIDEYLFSSFALEFKEFYKRIKSIYQELTTLTPNETVSNPMISSFVEALLAGDEHKVRQLFNNYLGEFDSEIEFLDCVIKPAMVQVGTAWENSEITVAKEHIATGIIERILNNLHLRFPASQSGENRYSVFLITPEEQIHKLGIQILDTLFESKGWRVARMNFGKNDRSIFEAIKLFNPDLIVCSIMTPSSILTIKGLVDELRADDSMFHGKIAVGGQAFYRTDPPIILENVDFQSNLLSELETFIDSFTTH